MQQRETPPALHEIAPGDPAALAAAVDRALALDPAERFATPRRCAARSRTAPRGRPTPPTGHLGHPDRRGRCRHRRDHRSGRDRGDVGRGPARWPRASRASPGRRAARRRPSPRPRRAARASAPRPGRRKPRSGFRQTMGMFLILVLLAAGGAAAVIATSGSTDAVNLRQVVYDNVQQGVDAVKGLVQDNTR